MGNLRVKSGNCQRCGIWREHLHREHKIPKWQGGTEHPSNIQYWCANCHEDKTRAEMKLRRHSEEELQKMRGRKHTEEELEKMRGYKHTEEARQRMSEAGKRRVFSPEHMARLSAGQKARWDRKRAGV